VSAYGAGVDSIAAGDALERVGLRGSQIVEIVGGWAFWTFDVDGRWIARFPRRPDIGLAARRELALLPELARHVSFQVPAPSHRSTRRGQPFFVYPRIPGRAFTAADATPKVLHQVGAMLRELHDFPLDRAAQLLGTGAPSQAWRAHLEGLWPVIERVALPCMGPKLASDVAREFRRFLSKPLEFPHCLIHNDLGLEHILIDEASATPVGLIDFESAWIGDPAVDFVPLRAALSQAEFDQLLDNRSLGDDLSERMWFYRWMGSVHAIIYGVTEDSESERQSGLTELERRFHLPH
jgi:aminoglycoside 2''-phosphotransferase